MSKFESYVSPDFYDEEYYLSLEYRYFSRAHASRIRSIFNFIGNVEGKRILDFGGGAGYFGEMFRRLGAEVVVMDFSEAAISWGKKRFPELAFVQGDASSLLRLSKQYDVVLALDVIEHLENPRLLLQNVKSVLLPQGRLYIATDNADSVFNRSPFLKRLDGFISCFSGEGRDFDLIQRVESYRRKHLGIDYHQGHISPFSIKQLANLVVENSWLIDRYKTYHFCSSSLKDILSLALGKDSGVCMIFECSLPK